MIDRKRLALSLAGFGIVLALHPTAFAQQNEALRNIAAAALPSVPATASADRVALVIGNSAYKPLPPLTNPAHDAEDVCEAVKSVGFDASCYFDVADRMRFREIVRAFIDKLRPGSAAFFYFAGHAVQLNNENYLLPTTIAPRRAADVDDEGIRLSFLLDSLAEARSSPNIVILDACRDNPFGRTVTGITRAGLAGVNPPVGTVLVYATAPGRTVRDGIGRNSLFAKHLVSHLPQPGLKLQELFASVADKVEKEARTSLKTEQVPYTNLSYNAPYCLAGCESQPTVAQTQELQKLREEAARQIRALTEENEKLRQEADARASAVALLEQQIGKLQQSLASSTDKEKIAASDRELKRLRSELALAQSRQDEAMKAQAANAARDAEINQWKGRVAELERQQAQLDERYRRQIEQLQRESELRARQEAEREKRRAQSPPAPAPQSNAPFRMPPSF